MRLYLRDAFGRFRPKFGSKPRYTRRAADLARDARLREQQLNVYRGTRVRVLAPDRVSVQFSAPPNRRPGKLPRPRQLHGKHGGW